jgi:hypothetical protein
MMGEMHVPGAHSIAHCEVTDAWPDVSPLAVTVSVTFPAAVPICTTARA